jgi:hypothetical protein
MSDKKTRAAELKRLSDQANTISAMLSTIHILDAGCQVEELLDCSSLADDFARDLDAFVSDAASEGSQSMSVDASKPATKDATPAITRDSMRILGEQAGEHALKDLEGCVDPAVAFEGWREHCYAELAEELAGHVDLPDLLTVWARAFDFVQPLGLSPRESDLLKAYRLSDDRGRETLSEAAERMAEDWPRYTFVVPRENCGEGA